MLDVATKYTLPTAWLLAVLSCGPKVDPTPPPSDSCGPQRQAVHDAGLGVICVSQAYADLTYCFGRSTLSETAVGTAARLAVSGTAKAPQAGVETTLSIEDQASRDLYAKYGTGHPAIRNSAAAAVDACVAHFRRRAGLPSLPDTVEPKPRPSHSAPDRVLPELMRVEGGCFVMGSSPDSEPMRDDDEVQHEVCVADLDVGKHEVTFEQYDHFAEETGKGKPHDENWGRERRPVINVDFQDALDYAKWLSLKLKREVRLPTEAEWEFFARGGTSGPYWWDGSEPHDMANLYGKTGRDRFDFTAPVGSFAANPAGLYDTSGNVWEYTCSAHARNPNGSEQRCVAPGFVGELVLRGGSFDSSAKWLRNAARGRNTSTRNAKFGFRVVAPVPGTQHD